MSRLLNKTNKYTYVHVNDEPGMGGANHKYSIFAKSQIEGDPDALVGDVNFQDGPILEAGINGVMNEDLLVIIIDRLQGFQKGNYACRENAICLTKLEEVMMWLRKRTQDREDRGVECTSAL